MKLAWRTIFCPLNAPVTLLMLMGFVASTQDALAQDYPTRPITLIVPLAAGGGVDTLARILADRMKLTLGQPVVVENIPTAAGTMGVGRLIQAAPDGYTIGIGDQTSHVISSVTNSVGYDVLKDLEPISLLSTSAVALVARKTIPAADVKQLIVWLREQPEGATAGSFGQGSGPHIIAATFQNLTGAKLRMVTYRGVAPAMQDVVGGHVDLMFVEQTSMIGHLRSGAIKAYAVLAKTRSAAIPEVPIMEEAGGPPLHIIPWRGLWAPKRIPADVLRKLSAAVLEALDNPAVQKRIAEAGQDIVPRAQQTPEALAAHHKSEMEEWLPMIKAATKAD
jgi:tripartite-type tricarboxylate transporter receptor subunit TctC